MATGMFGNQYQQAVTDETALRRQQANTGGMTGWGAITNAMSGIGSEIGYQSGQMFGGQTPAQVQQEKYQGVISSMPDFDPTDPTQMKEMSSKLWTGGFYDEGMAMLKESYEMQKVDALMQYYKDQGDAALLSSIPTNKRDTGIPQGELDIALGLVKSNFKHAWWDMMDQALPAGASEEGLALFIAQTARNTNNSMDEIINLVKSGKLSFSQGTTAASQAPAGNTEEVDVSVTLESRANR